MNKIAILEGILFISGDEGINIKEIIKLLDLNKEEAKILFKEYSDSLEHENRGLKLEIFGETLKLTTKKEHKEVYEKLTDLEINSPLTPSALETLAIISYNQPVTRNSVDEIRGVNSTHHFRRLYLKGLIEEVGKSDLPGRPKLYKTTDHFLDCFGIKSLEELPSINYEKIEIDETDLFDSRYKEGNEIE